MPSAPLSTTRTDVSEHAAGHFVSEFPATPTFWCLGFAYACFLAVTLQKLVLPLLPSLHAGSGLLNHDAILFHNVAVTLADRIHALGWSEWWQYFGTPDASGNVALLAMLYALLGPDPAWFIPVNAAAHATGATVLYAMGPVLWPGAIGRLGGAVAAVLFLAFPSALMWYGQNHKDAFAIAGVLLLLYAWARAFARADLPRGLPGNALLACAGVALIVFVRPYLLLVTSLALFASWCAMLAAAIARGRLRAESKTLVHAAILLALAAVPASQVRPTAHLEKAAHVYTSEQSVAWKWQRSDWLPERVDRLVEQASRVRIWYLDHNLAVGAGSLIDGNRMPGSAADALAYLPRALTIALLAPFPDDWFARISLFRVVGAIETLVWYLLLPGVVALAIARASAPLFAPAVACAVILTVYGYVQPNLGTLYRDRFGLLFFFILCGAIGWARIVLSMLAAGAKPPRAGAIERPEGGTLERAGIPDMMRTAGSGAVVVVLALVGYLGFLARDLLLLRQFGMGATLDVFFLAAMAPNFLVAFLSLPFADAMTAPLLGLRASGSPQERERYLRSILSFACAFLLLVGGLLYLGAHGVMSVMLGAGREGLAASGAGMLHWFSLILIFSAWTVIGNGALNALSSARIAASAQLVVPATAILAILAFAPALGVYAAIYGMLAGMAANIVLVIGALRWREMWFVPGPIVRAAEFRGTLRTWAILCVAALFTAASVPINFSFAGSLGDGAISAWALGSKLVQFFTGLSSVAIAAVILPHLGRLSVHGARSRAKADLYFFLMGGTWISIACALVIVAFAEPVVAATLEGNKVTAAEAIILAEVLKLGALQLPFVTGTVLVLKYAAVSGMAIRAALAAAAGLALNIALNLVLVPQSGVLGIATATAIGAGFAAICLVVTVRAHAGLAVMEIAPLVVSWLVWAGLCLAMQYRSSAAAATCAIALLFLVQVQWRSWRAQSMSIAAAG